MLRLRARSSVGLERWFPVPEVVGSNPIGRTRKLKKYCAPIAQRIRVLGFEPSGRRFESCWVYQNLFMTKILDAAELVDYIKARQLHQIRTLIQADKIVPRLAIFGQNDFSREVVEYLNDFSSEIYDKKMYESFEIDETKFREISEDASFQGIFWAGDDELFAKFIAELPPVKDIAGLRENSPFDSVKQLADKYLLAGFNLERKPDEIKNFEQLEIAALVDNLLRTCRENFAK